MYPYPLSEEMLLQVPRRLSFFMSQVTRKSFEKLLSFYRIKTSTPYLVYDVRLNYLVANVTIFPNLLMHFNF